MRRSATALFRLIDRLCPPAGDPVVESRIPAAIPGQNPWETFVLAILTVFQAGTWIALGWMAVFPANNWSWIALSIALGPAIFLGLHLWNFTIGAIAQLLLGGGSLRVTRLNLLGVTIFATVLVTRVGWERWCGAVWLLWAGLNLIAWAVLMVMRKSETS